MPSGRGRSRGTPSSRGGSRRRPDSQSTRSRRASSRPASGSLRSGSAARRDRRTSISMRTPLLRRGSREGCREDSSSPGTGSRSGCSWSWCSSCSGRVLPRRARQRLGRLELTGTCRRRTMLGGRGAPRHDRRGPAGAAGAVPLRDRLGLRATRVRAAGASAGCVRRAASPPARHRPGAVLRRHPARATGRLRRGLAAWPRLVPRFALRRSRRPGAGVGSRLLEAAWSDGDLRRRTLTDAIQPISNALYARRGLVPATPLLSFSGVPTRSGSESVLTDRCGEQRRRARRSGLRVRPLCRPSSLGRGRRADDLASRRPSSRLLLPVPERRCRPGRRRRSGRSGRGARGGARAGGRPGQRAHPRVVTRTRRPCACSGPSVVADARIAAAVRRDPAPDRPRDRQLHAVLDVGRRRRSAVPPRTSARARRSE